MKLLIDMNLTPDWVPYLEAAGFAAEHWSSLGPVTAPDTEIITQAKVAGYVIFTRDLDFGAILALTHGDQPSVVQLRVMELLPEEIGDTVVAALRQAENALEKGALLTIDPHRSRLKLLPLSLPQ
jgi:predicted nuclease of predicted toxin-antitoxin system